ncbi:MAG TPA: CCA tRNA nucleotidyltransferase [Rhabdochlamydiaceae bacterium]|jgi:poly(A) polymerase
MPARPFAKAVVKKLVDAGFIAYFAGGWVRDYLMKHPSDDIDIATSAPVAAIQSLFPKTIPVGISFGIVIVVEQGHHFEVATFRKEGGYYDGRRPTRIEQATPEEDALRRDFTINGMFWDPLREQLFDYVGGEADIKSKIIRAIGNPHERFYEDRLRMMRAVRYSTRFDFPIETLTKEAIADHAASLLPSVAMERIWQEFKKMSQFSHFDKGLVTLHELHLLQTIFFRLKEISSSQIQKRVSALKDFPKNAPTISELLELFPDDTLEQLLALSDYLKLSKEDRECARFLHHARSLLSMPADWLQKMEKVEWAHFYAHKHADLSLYIRSAHLQNGEREAFLQEHRKRKEGLKPAIARIVEQRPLVTAEMLMQEGIPAGKNMGILLKEAERIAINSDREIPSEIIGLLKKSPLWHH